MCFLLTKTFTKRWRSSLCLSFLRVRVLTHLDFGLLGSLEPGLCHNAPWGFQSAQHAAHAGPISAQSSWKSREIGVFPIVDLKEAMQKCFFSPPGISFSSSQSCLAQGPVLCQCLRHRVEFWGCPVQGQELLNSVGPFQPSFFCDCF